MNELVHTNQKPVIAIRDSQPSCERSKRFNISLRDAVHILIGAWIAYLITG